MFVLFSEALIKLVEIILSLLPDIVMPVIEVSAVVIDIISIAHFILPVNVVTQLFTMSIGITCFRFILAMILRIKSFVPTWGN